MLVLLKSMLNVTLSVCQSVTHVLLRDLSNHYWYEEIAEANRLHDLVTEIKEKTSEEIINAIVLNFKRNKQEIKKNFAQIKYENQCERNENAIQTNSDYSDVETHQKNSETLEENKNYLANENNFLIFTKNENLYNEKEGTSQLQVACLNYEALSLNSVTGVVELNEVGGYDSSNKSCGDNYIDHKNLSATQKELEDINTNIIHLRFECHPCLLEETDWIKDEIINETLGNECDTLLPESSTDTFKFELVDKNNNVPIFSKTTEKSGLIESFNDIESNCYDNEWVNEFLSEVIQGCFLVDGEDNSPNRMSPEKGNTDTEIVGLRNVSEKTEEYQCYCSQVHGCLQTVDFDKEDELVGDEQLQSVETGSVSDWLYRVSPALCLLPANNIIKVSPEEVEEIIDQQESKTNQEDFDEIIIKKLFIHQWLDDTSKYNIDYSPLTYACGDNVYK